MALAGGGVDVQVAHAAHRIRFLLSLLLLLLVHQHLLLHLRSRVLLSRVFEVVLVLVEFMAVLSNLLVSKRIGHNGQVLLLLLLGTGRAVVSIAATLSGVREVQIHTFVVLFAVWIQELVV